MKAVTKKINGIEFAVNGEIRVSSKQVAEKFNKYHHHVLRDIRELISKGVTNFGLSSYMTSQNKEMPEFLMDRDGFSLLVMGFTGDEALKWKQGFLSAFNAMEKYIVDDMARKKADDIARLECPAMAKALVDIRVEAGKDTKPHHFSNEHNLIYRIVLGCTKKKWCESEDINPKDRFRDHLLTPMIEAVEELQRVNTSMIEMGFEYQERKKRLDMLYTKKYLDRCLQAVVDDNA